MSILVCGATRTELMACERGIAVSRVPRGSFVSLLTGVGPIHAARRLEAHLATNPKPSLIVSSGFAGSLTDRISVGDWIVATEISFVDEAIPIPVTLRIPLALAKACAIVTAHEPVLDPSALPSAARHAEAVDMESAAIARVASARGIPVAVIRLISDAPSRPLPRFLSDFGKAMAEARWSKKVIFSARGVGRALGDPGGVARLLGHGAGWTRELARGWSDFAPAIVAEASSPRSHLQTASAQA